ncbi:MAG: hypothetical protein ACJAZN_001194 [Planctomycetota bacterium]
MQACRSSVSATPTWPELISHPGGQASASHHLWPENSNGFSLHAATVVPKGKRTRLEKLCRYISRPALCLKRVEVRSDGNIVWSLRKVWRDGTKSFVFTPHEFIAKLAALVPHPREHQLTYQGVLAPASPLRGGTERRYRTATDSATQPPRGGPPAPRSATSSPPSRWLPSLALSGRISCGSVPDETGVILAQTFGLFPANRYTIDPADGTSTVEPIAFGALALESDGNGRLFHAGFTAAVGIRIEDLATGTTTEIPGTGQETSNVYGMCFRQGVDGEGGHPVCDGLLNSTGRPATLETIGTSVLAQNELTLYTRQLPNG